MSMAIILDDEVGALKLNTSEDQIIGWLVNDEEQKETYYRHERSDNGEKPNGLYYHICEINGSAVFEEDFQPSDAIIHLSSGGCFSEDEKLLDLIIAEAIEHFHRVPYCEDETTML